MSQRQHIYVNLKAPCDGGQSPNQFVPWITAEIRLYWPSHIDSGTVEALLTKAIAEAWKKLEEES